MNIDLVDKAGCAIQATCYNDAATKWNDVLQEGKVYSMGSGIVKMANKRYTTIPNDHCLTFDVHAQITPIEERSIEFKSSPFNFTTLQQVQDATQIYMIDLIAVVTEVQPASQI